MNQSSPQDAGYQSNTNRWQWPLLCVLGVAAFVLGVIGYMYPGAGGAKPFSFLDALYDSLKLFHTHFDHREQPLPWTLQVARFLAPLVVGFSVVKAFFVIGHGHRRALLHQSKREHVVICGLGRKAFQLARDYSQQGQWVVVIERDANNVLLQECEIEKILYWIGDAGQPSQLERARVHCAKLLVAATGDDGKNVEVSMRAAELCRKRPPEFQEPLRCLVHVVDPRLRRLFRDHQVFTATSDRFRASMIDFYENFALALFQEHPLDGELGVRPGSKTVVRLVIVSFGQMGESVLLQAARIGHFTDGKKVHATVIDPQAAQLKQGFFRRYPYFDHTCAVEFVAADFDSPEVSKRVEGWRSEQDTVLTFAVCCDDDTRSMTAALYLRSLLKNRRAPILARMASTGGLATLLQTAGTKVPFGDIYPFATLEKTCTPNVPLHPQLDAIAKIIYENPVRTKKGQHSKEGQPTGTNAATQPWHLLDDDHKNANRRQALHHQIKLRTIGCAEQDKGITGQHNERFTETEIELLVKMEHARRCAERWLGGCEYEESGEDEDKDRESVKQIPKLLNVVRRNSVERP